MREGEGSIVLEDRDASRLAEFLRFPRSSLGDRIEIPGHGATLIAERGSAGAPIITIYEHAK